MKKIDVRGIQSEPEKRLSFLTDFVGFTEDDWKALGESVEVLGPRLPGILDALYDHLLNYDDTRKVFLGPRGEVDPNYIAIRKEHLTSWLLTTVGGSDRRALANYIMATGRRHTGVEGEPERVVPPRYMVALTSFVQTAILSNLFDLLPNEPDKLRRIGLAWNKMMLIQLEMFLKALVPYWPRWDEA
ncbi:MAG TPA: protoglobin family protein [Blastocatellia bacterium]|nr:protoglobin family protein [Blastocatellia bacterium]